MAADGEPPPPAGERIGDEVEAGAAMCYLQKFKLYETTSKFYMIGRDKSRTQWRVLKIDRLEPSELSIREDSTTYSTNECHDLLKRIHEGNMPSGGLKFVTNCYGIVGFIKFLGPYYMLLITKRRPIGSICGHTVYAITKSTIISISNSTARSEIYNSKNENRYKKLLCSVDLTKDFFFSYSYHVMRSLQKNLCDNQKGQVVYETMFVWNEFLTRGIRNHLKSTLWTVALVYGFFKQAKLRVEEKEFKLTLIARRSRHYAGTRYLKRGINEKGRVANDVETEQIVFEDVPAGCPAQITSIIQNRGSIPLFWSQETSKLNIKPDIVLLKKDQNYEATRLHFENLVKRYGNPIIIMNLIKTRERKPRESKLRAEFANAINFINKDLSGEDHLRFLHWDLSRHAGSKATSALALLGKVATYALTLTGFFYCQVTPALRLDDALTLPIHGKDGVLESDSDGEEEIDSSRNGYEDNEEYSNNCLTKHSMFQNGVLRTNCIDCLDRTNVAQYAYGLAALGHQLHRLGLIDEPKIDLDDSLADDLMSFYETMGDTLALQYTGSAAHNKIFSERRGHWKAAVQSQEFFRTLQRYYSNAYMDAEKQDAINIFLGHFQPQQDKPALWELEFDQHCNVGRQQNTQSVENSRTFFRGSLSDGNILREGNAPISGISVAQKKNTDSTLPNGTSRGGDFNGLSDIAPEIPARECNISFSFSRYTPSMISRQLFVQHSDHICSNENRACESNYSNFLDLDWLSPSGNSCEEEMYEMSSLNNSSLQGLSSENVINVTDEETASQFSESRSSIRDHDSTETALLKKSISGISGQFVNWVMNGGTFYN